MKLILRIEKLIPLLMCILIQITHSFDRLPPDLTQAIVINILATDAKNTQTIALISKEFNQYVTIHNIKILKTEHLEKAKTHPINSKIFAQRYTSTTYIIYTQVNDGLIKESNLEKYTAAIKKNPYADPNYGVELNSLRLHYILCWRPQTTNDFLHCITDKQTKESWVKALCEHGATVFRYVTKDKNILDSILENILSPCIEYNEKKRLYFPEFILLLKYAKEEISENDLFCAKVLKKTFCNEFYFNRKPFMQDCIDYLKIVKEHGFDIKKKYQNPLHFHLYKNEIPAIALVKYLLEEGFDPYENIDMHDGSNPQSAYGIAQTIQDATLQENILKMFEEISTKNALPLS